MDAPDGQRAMVAALQEAADVKTWLDVCREFAARHGIEPRYVDALQTFNNPFPRGGPPKSPEGAFEGSFEELERATQRSEVLQAVAEDLSAEVDRGQAAMFQRRACAVDELLAGFGDPTGRLLRVGLRWRLAGIAQADRPRAPRVRALADFYWSYAGWHEHRRALGSRSAPSVLHVAARITWQRMGPGVERARLHGVFAQGPVHTNVLRFEPAGVRVRVLHVRAHAPDVPFDRLVEAEGALAGTSGGFFLYSEPDIAPPQRRFDPVGLLVEQGRVRSPPVFPRGALAVGEDGRWQIERIGSTGMTMATPRSPAVSMDGVWTRAEHRRGPATRSTAVAAGTIVEVGEGLAIPLNGFVAALPPQPGVRATDRVAFSVPKTADGRPIVEGIAGGPLLLREGRICIDFRAEGFWGGAPPITFSQDETGDRNLLPRLAAGIDAHGRLVLAAIDGRNFEHALGATLHGVARLMRALGCHTATNLDGGSSKRMVLGGQILDLPSTEIEARPGATQAVRPVHTAVLFEPA